MSSKGFDVNQASWRQHELRRWLWLSFFALAAWQFIWYGLLQPPAKLSIWVALSIALVPLLPGLIGYQLRQPLALIAAGIAVLGYFIFALMELKLGGPARWLSGVQTLICSAFFLLWLQIVITEKRAKKALLRA